MVELLETIMLICFGLSWPVSLVRTLRQKSAGASISFMCLILAGYFAGITAKVMSFGFNLVFYVYLLNILMVSTNLIVTIRFRLREKSTKKLPEGIKA